MRIFLLCLLHLASYWPTMSAVTSASGRHPNRLYRTNTGEISLSHNKDWLTNQEAGSLSIGIHQGAIQSTKQGRSQWPIEEISIGHGKSDGDIIPQQPPTTKYLSDRIDELEQRVEQSVRLNKDLMSDLKIAKRRQAACEAETYQVKGDIVNMKRRLENLEIQVLGPENKIMHQIMEEHMRDEPRANAGRMRAPIPDHQRWNFDNFLMEIEQLAKAAAQPTTKQTTPTTTTTTTPRTTTTTTSKRVPNKPSSFMKSKKYLNQNYFLSQEGAARSDQEAVRKCGELGGHLAEINNQAEFDFIATFLDDVPGYIDWVYISGTDRAHEGKWVHQRTGQALGFTKWFSGAGPHGQPNGTPGEDCMLMAKADSWLWHDWMCTGKGFTPTNRFLCEVHA